MRPAPIDVTGVDLVRLAQAAYRLSAPVVGPPDLRDRHAWEFVTRDPDNPFWAMRLWEVWGRKVDLFVHRREDRLEIDGRWGRHSPAELEGMLEWVWGRAA